MTPKDWPARKFPANGVPETSIATCRTNDADLPFMHIELLTTRPTTGSPGMTRCIFASGRTGSEVAAVCDIRGRVYGGVVRNAGVAVQVCGGRDGLLRRPQAEHGRHRLGGSTRECKGNA